MAAESPATTPAAVRELVADTGGGTSPERGAELHEFVREHRPESCLELGFAWGVSAMYIASALEANGAGRLTSVDIPYEQRRAVVGEELLTRAGLKHRVEVVLEDGGYNYFLLRRLREQLRDDRVEPAYDFVFIDGAHTWVDDALALQLVDRLLKPGGWLLLDDFGWVPADAQDVPPAHRGYAHIQQVFELLLVPDPTYDQLFTDGSVARARKAVGVPASRVVYRQDLLGSARAVAGYARTRVRRALAR